MPAVMTDQDWQTASEAIGPFGTLIKQEVARRLAAERERCAKIAEEFNAAGKPIADAIRRS